MRLKSSNIWRLVLSAYIILAAFGCGGGGGGGGGGGKTGPGDTGNYFPFTVGNTWTYRVTSSTSGAASLKSGAASSVLFSKLLNLTGRYTKRFAIAQASAVNYSTASITGTKVVNGVTVIVYASGIEEDYYLKDSNGITYYGNNDTTDTLTPQLTPYQMVNFPLVAGSGFVQANKTGLDAGDLDEDGKPDTVDVYSSVTVAGFETVTVPVGTFSDCARIDTNMTMTFHSSLYNTSVIATGVDTTWVAPGIGIVKEKSVLTIGTIYSDSTYELIGYTVDGRSGGNPEVGISVLAQTMNPSHLVVKNENLFWSDASETPVKRISTNGGTAIPLANGISVATNIAISGQYIFWIDEGARINRASLDGTSTTRLAQGMRSAGGTTDICVDDTYVYWVDSVSSPNTYTIKKTPLSGGNSEILTTTPKEIAALGADTTHIYWEEQGIGPITFPNGPEGSTINKVLKSGGDITVLVNGTLNGLIQPPIDPNLLAGSWHPRGGIEVKGTEILFADTDFVDSYRVMKVSTDGGSITLLTDVITNDPSNFVRGLVTDDINAYWIDKSSVNKIPIAGGSVTPLVSDIYSTADIAVSGGSIVWTETECCATRQNGSVKKISVTGDNETPLISGLDNPGALAMDSSNIYWTEGKDYGHIEGYGRIVKIPVDGGSATTVVDGILSNTPPIAVDDTHVYIADKWMIKKVPVAGGSVESLFHHTEGVADIATDGINVYWIDGFANIFKIPVTGGNVLELNTVFTGGPPGPIRVANGYVYWMDHYDTIKRVSISGGPESTIAYGLPFLSDFVVDGTSVYFSEQDTGDIRKVSVNGGSISTLLDDSPLYSPYILALDDSNVYWINQADVGKIPITGGSPTFIVSGSVQSDPFYPGSIAVNGTSLYWTEMATGEIKKATPK